MLDTALGLLFRYHALTLVLVAALLIFVADLGHRAGWRVHLKHDEPRRTVAVGVVSSVLGLLALVLAFTFTMAVERYGVRRDQVVGEANAIGTTWLRTDFAPAPHGARMRDALGRYADARLAFYAAGRDTGKQMAAQQLAGELQRELWAEMTAAVKEQPTPPVAALAVALNQVIDFDALRLHALREHVPGGVWLMVLIVAVFAFWVSGYYAGANGGRSSVTHLVLPVLIAAVIALTSDLDDSRGGLIGISQKPLIEVKAMMAAGAH